MRSFSDFEGAFLGSLERCLVAGPLAADAQQGTKMPRVGYLSVFSSSNPYHQ